MFCTVFCIVYSTMVYTLLSTVICTALFYVLYYALLCTVLCTVLCSVIYNILCTAFCTVSTVRILATVLTILHMITRITFFYTLCCVCSEKRPLVLAVTASPPQCPKVILTLILIFLLELYQSSMSTLLYTTLILTYLIYRVRFYSKLSNFTVLHTVLPYH
jgi:hypothetical protein